MIVKSLIILGIAVLIIAALMLVVYIGGAVVDYVRERAETRSGRRKK